LIRVTQALTKASADSRQWVSLRLKDSRSYHNVLPGEMPSLAASVAFLPASTTPWVRAVA
jgi:hypothetical protein